MTAGDARASAPINHVSIGTAMKNQLAACICIALTQQCLGDETLFTCTGRIGHSYIAEGGISKPGWSINDETKVVTELILKEPAGKLGVYDIQFTSEFGKHSFLERFCPVTEMIAGPPISDRAFAVDTAAQRAAGAGLSEVATGKEADAAFRAAHQQAFEQEVPAKIEQFYNPPQPVRAFVAAEQANRVRQTAAQAQQHTGAGTSIVSYGADPTGAADSTAAIQAAIDAAYNKGNGSATITCPDGNYKISYPIFLDAPGNLRSALNSKPWDNSSFFQVGSPHVQSPNGNMSTDIVTDNGQQWYPAPGIIFNNKVPHLSPNYWKQYTAWSNATTYHAGYIVQMAITGGTGYTTGVYNTVSFTGGSGRRAVGQVTVSGGAVTTIYMSVPLAAGYVVGDVLTTANTNIGGTGSGFSFTVTQVGGDIVQYQGFAWMAITNNNLNNTPVTILTGNPFTAPAWQPIPARPTNFAFSLVFNGSGSIGSGQNNRGCNLKPTFNNTPIFWIGSGSGLAVRNVQINVPSVAWRGALNPDGVGFAIAGGNGGAHNTLIENTEVDNVYTCMQTGVNQDALADSNTFRKNVCGNCYYGVYISKTQNDINHVDDPTFSCTVNIFSGVGPQVLVTGGNLSATVSQRNSFTVSGTSAINVLANPHNTNTFIYQFNTTISAPDAFVPLVYNAYMMVTAHFGVIPLVPVKWNSGTNVMQFQILTDWGLNFFGGNNAVSQSDLQSEILAVTKVYAIERVTTYQGEGITAIGQHVENPSACTTLVENGHGFAGDIGMHFTRIRLNADPSFPQYVPANNPGDAALALYYCSKVFGLVIGDPSAYGIEFDQIQWEITANEPVLFDWGSDCASCGFNSAPNNTNFYVANGYQNIGAPSGMVDGGGIASFTPGSGAGYFTSCIHWPRFNQFNSADWRIRFQGSAQSPCKGFFPAPNQTPRIIPSQLPSGALGALSTYPLIHGGTIYSVVDWNSGTLTNLHARSAHSFYSWGQNLTTSNIPGLSWSYKAGGAWVYVDSNTMNYMFQGLGITLNSGSGAGPKPYVVTGVYPGLGYITVQQASANNNGNGLEGANSTTVYSGNVITQQPYSWTQYP
jgi:hypothetical protein